MRNARPPGGAFYCCPYWTFGQEYPFGDTSFYDGDVLPVDEPLREKAVLDATQKKIVLDYGDRTCGEAEGIGACEFPTGDFRGNSNTTAKVVLKRVVKKRK